MRRGPDPTRAAIPAAELERMLSTEPLPEPFWPDEAGPYAPVPPPEAELEAAVRNAFPRLVDVDAVARTSDGTLATGRDARSGASVSVRLPSGSSCAVPTSVEAGGRYLFLTEASPDASGAYAIYEGTGARHSLSRVDATGSVRVGGEPQDVLELLARVESGS